MQLPRFLSRRQQRLQTAFHLHSRLFDRLARFRTHQVSEIRKVSPETIMNPHQQVGTLVVRKSSHGAGALARRIDGSPQNGTIGPGHQTYR